MTEERAIAIMIEHMESLFPKTCPNCHRTFATLRDYFLNTEPTGNPIAYDLELDDLTPLRPIGAVAVSNCQCGTSLALTSQGMALLRLWMLLHWAKEESQKRGVTPPEFLLAIRHEIRQRVLSMSESK